MITLRQKKQITDTIIGAAIVFLLIGIIFAITTPEDSFVPTGCNIERCISGDTAPPCK